ncbi:MAG: hypothetical protein GXO74_01190 [Calditrichaeota bacterium]|nr:hypothetical protein [Calditrichota bacterium]
MRRMQNILPRLLFVIFLATFLFAGCYTQLERPRVDTDDEYYYEEETAPEEQGQSQQEPYYDQSDTTVVNYNYYNNNYYFDPFMDPWDYWYGANYNPYFYGYYYSGFYPGYWWDPYYHPYYPGWYAGFYGGYYDWWNYDNYWYGGGMYWVAGTKKKRSFDRRSIGQLDREVRRVQRESVRKVQRVPRSEDVGNRIVDRGDNRRGQLEPNRQTRPVSGERQTLAKPKNDALPNRDARKTTVNRRRMTIVRPEGRIIKRRPTTGKTYVPQAGRKTIVRAPGSDARPDKNVRKPSSKRSGDAIRTNPKSKSKRPAPQVRPKSKYNPPRISKKGNSSSYRPHLRPAARTNRSSTSIRRSSRSIPSRSYTRPSTSRPSSHYSRPSVNHSSGSVSRPAPSRSSSSGSKSSGSKTKNK